MSYNAADITVQCWRLDGAGRSAVFSVYGGGVPALTYFGARLPANEELEQLARMALPNIAGGQLDPLVPLTLLPTPMEGWQGRSGVQRADHGVATLHFQSAERPDANRLAFRVSGDFDLAIEVFLCAQTGLMSLRVSGQDSDGLPEGLAASIPVPSQLSRIIDHGGRWCGEFQRQETRFRTGRHVRESHEGRTGHAHFPGVIVAADNCSEHTGTCMGMTFEWSGGHQMIAEQVPDGRRHVQFGVPGRAPPAAKLWIGWSETGFNGLSQSMHAHLRATPGMTTERPVHYNCWEAVYFRHDVDELKEIATRAAALGAERFVLDDGWFKGRNDDRTSLGDWVVDKEIYPDGLHPLVDHITDLGMSFGLWLEPEMVSVDSDLYRAHPDWLLGPQNQPSGRYQHVLDLSKPEVTEYLFSAIADLLTEYPITYIKWDHNRALTGATPEQTKALYSLFVRLKSSFPAVEIETCASGGGRMDYGILAHTSRVWLSDSNDALERLRMQHEASRWLPPEVQGSHAGPRVCHTSGRLLPIEFRAWVAAQRHMGLEMDPRELDDSEALALSRVIKWYKENREFMFSAQYHRLESPDSEVFAEIFVASDQHRFIAFKGQMGASATIADRGLAMTGLESEALYELRLVNPEDVPPILNRHTATAFMSGAPVRLSGAALMAGAFHLPNAYPSTMMVVEGKKIETNRQGTA